MTMTFFFSHIQSSSFQGFEVLPLSKRQNFFPANAFLDFSSSVVVFLFCFFPLCMRSHPVLHTPRHARCQAYTTHPYILSHMRHAQPDSWPRPPGGEGGSPLGPLVGGDEPGSSALSPDIHTQWVHSHTCLIAWPIGGGAH